MPTKKVYREQVSRSGLASPNVTK